MNMVSNEIKMHYASPGLYERIVQGLEAIGKSPASVHLDDLAAVDEFHLRGPAATRELIEILDVGADSHVLEPLDDALMLAASGHSRRDIQRHLDFALQVLH